MAAHTIRFELLGPLRALRGQEELPLGPPMQRTVLAVLLHLDGKSMSFGGLVDAVWGAEPPAHVRNLVQKYVSGLRRALRDDGAGAGTVTELVWTGSGYRLCGARIDDLHDRRELVRAAVAARDLGDLGRAGELAGAAEALWRGEYAEGLAGPYLEAERRRWAEKRMLVLEARLEGGIALGRYEECVHELVRLVAAHPLRERPVALLMLALYRNGRSSDALLAYEEARRRIAETMGADPGPALRALHERILRQDPALLGGVQEMIGGAAVA
ncbi:MULTISPECIES: AfsR/SARP family transcriptional regulator [Streptomyces]|uniref:BTAD domain-containing putative transcriptional regulator n=1 Tax=Streptomyces solicathayae TaxID=3081768 RepID=A0ABZ0M351_9ACTN|nr:BTAD domain-containing putative transcriptional regulator [Streptomyces sp. HUAS YS2]WOX26070.1 BTAD domain-containing putative transcriptional regulator [Streptomyces sp. HUAS YS2]